MPRVTVAILAYNRPEFLREAIESVLAQTYTDFKLVVYDNCSEKDLKSVVDQYDDPRIVYHRNEKNLGMFGNAAQAVDLCDTELLDIFHDDDRMFPWALERLVEAMDLYPQIAIVSGSHGHTMGSGGFSHYRENRHGRLYKKGDVATEDVFRTIKLTFSGFLLRVPLLRKHDHNFRLDKGVASDTYFIIESYLIGLDIFAFDAPMVEYRIHPGSGTNTSALDTWSDTLKKCVELVESYLPNSMKAIGMRKDMHNILIALFAPSVFCGAQAPFQAIKEFRNYMEKEMESKLSNTEFNDAFCVSILGSTITAVGRREASISDYHARIADLKKIGISVPLKRRLKWFLKYIVWQRWLGHR